MSKIVVITGATDGIGKQTAIDLAKKDYFVVIHGRNEEKCKQTIEEIKSNHQQADIDLITGDLSIISDIESISRQIHEKFDYLDILINNAGILRNKHSVLPNELEETFMVNHLAPVYLTYLVIDLLKKAPQGRIINVSSQIHSSRIDFDNLQGEKRFNGSEAYSLSKLGNIFFTNALAERLQNTNSKITVNSLHPGVIATKLLRQTFGAFGSSVQIGAETPVYLADSPEVTPFTGKYFVNKRITEPKSIVYDRNAQEKLLKISEEILGINFEKKLREIYYK